jgi:hypothetical protein
MVVDGVIGMATIVGTAPPRASNGIWNRAIRAAPAIVPLAAGNSAVRKDRALAEDSQEGVPTTLAAVPENSVPANAEASVLVAKGISVAFIRRGPLLASSRVGSVLVAKGISVASIRQGPLQAPNRVGSVLVAKGISVEYIRRGLLLAPSRVGSMVVAEGISVGSIRREPPRVPRRGPLARSVIERMNTVETTG